MSNLLAPSHVSSATSRRVLFRELGGAMALAGLPSFGLAQSLLTSTSASAVGQGRLSTPFITVGHENSTPIELYYEDHTKIPMRRAPVVPP